MTDEQQVRALLSRAANSLGEINVPSTSAFVRPVRDRRRVLATLAPVCVALAVIGLAVGLHNRERGHAPAAKPKPVGVQQLLGYRWQKMPRAPIATRDAEASAWTGKQLLIWGGERGTRIFGDGAAYDPATRTWTTLPPAPLSARAGAAYAWSGSRFVVWGGFVVGPGFKQLIYRTDGAAYNPATRTWTKMPRPPVSMEANVSAYALDSHVVFLSPTSPTTPRAPKVITTSRYDPRTNTWIALPPLRLKEHHDSSFLVGLEAGSRLFIWSEWTQSFAATGSIGAGIDAYTLDPARGVWSSNPTLVAANAQFGRKSVANAQWTGTSIVLPAGRGWTSGLGGPINRPDVPGAVVDPTTGHRTAIAPSPFNDDVSYVWTGATLLGLDGGAVQAWDPHTNIWTKLATQPTTTGEGIVIWTGTEAIVWGEPFNGRGATVGLEFRAPSR